MAPRQNLPGKFIVIDGGDGTGKTTQFKLLADYLTSINIKTRLFDFPRYYNNYWGKMAGIYLRGKYGGLYQNTPHLSTLPFILDQSDARFKILYALRRGTFVLSNRYISSNIHQASKLPYYEQDAFVEWLEETAFEKLRAVRPDLTIVLHVPTSQSKTLNEKKGDRLYLSGSRDIAETDEKHQTDAREVYQRFAKKTADWELVNCSQQNGKLKTPEQIHEEIVALLHKNRIFDNAITTDQLSLLNGKHA